MRRFSLSCACLMVLAVALAGCPKNGKDPAPGGQNESTENKAPEPAKVEPAATKTDPAAEGEPAATKNTPKEAPAAEVPANAKPQVLLETSMGNIKLELNREKAPKTVDNFMEYVRSGHYKGTVFHRIIDGFMIQGGGFDESFNKKSTRPPIKNEADNGLKNDRGTIAMARTGDPHSAAAQFFINVSNNVPLNHRDKSVRGWGYCVFGKVIDGMDVVNKIKNVKTGSKGPFSQDAPQENVIIKDAKAM